jgi:hypothetical protein
MKVRPARREDVETIIDFVVEEAREAESRTIDRGIISRGVAAAFDDERLARYWVLEDGDRIVGSISVVSEWSDWNAAPYWWIQCTRRTPWRSARTRKSGLKTRAIES